jgi:hypothetical protein
MATLIVVIISKTLVLAVTVAVTVAVVAAVLVQLSLHQRIHTVQPYCALIPSTHSAVNEHKLCI